MSQIKTIQLAGVTLAYKEFGSGDKYLLSTQNFFLSECHMELLGKPPYNYHCFLVYMRGYGQSTHIADSTPQNYISIWGEDMVNFAKAMHIASFYYTGVSHGNFAGWHIAFHYPQLLRGFVCCDGICQFRQAPSNAEKLHLPSESEIEKIVGNYEYLEKTAWMESWPTNNAQRLARREANHKEHAKILMARQKEEFMVPNNGDMTCCEAKTKEDFLQKLSQINVPVLVWVGGLDPLAKADAALEVAQAIPGASLLTYQHLGHGGADECAEVAARDCHRFFKDTENRVL